MSESITLLPLPDIEQWETRAVPSLTYHFEGKY